MKVSIITEGSRKYGFGHIARCTALYEAFKKKACAVQMIINRDDSVDHLLEAIEVSSFNWLNDQQKVLNLVKDSDIAVVDSYLADSSFYKKISDLVKKGVYLDDNQRIDYPQGTVINGAVYSQELNYPRKKDLTYLLGPDYALLRKDFWQIKAEPRKDTKDVLIAFGGGDRSDLIEQVKQMLAAKFKLNSLFIGKKATAKEVMKTIVKASFCISGGGQTTYELACCGVPGIGICFADNQLANLNKWQKIGFLEFVGRYNDPDLLEKIEKIITGLSQEKKQAMASIGRKYIDGQGALRAVDKVLE